MTIKARTYKESYFEQPLKTITGKLNPTKGAPPVEKVRTLSNFIQVNEKPNQSTELNTQVAIAKFNDLFKQDKDQAILVLASKVIQLQAELKDLHDKLRIHQRTNSS